MVRLHNTIRFTTSLTVYKWHQSLLNLAPNKVSTFFYMPLDSATAPSFPQNKPRPTQATSPTAFQSLQSLKSYCRNTRNQSTLSNGSSYLNVLVCLKSRPTPPS